jgi:hypothetical protein
VAGCREPENGLARRVSNRCRDRPPDADWRRDARWRARLRALHAINACGVEGSIPGPF